MEAPAMNPTSGVISKQPVMLDYKKDPTRPGGGVFVAASGKKADFQDVPAGTIISTNSEDGASGGGDESVASDSEGEVASLVAARAAAGANVSLPAQNHNDRAYNNLLFSPSPFAPASLPAPARTSNANTHSNTAYDVANADYYVTSHMHSSGGVMAPVSAIRGVVAVNSAGQMLAGGPSMVNFTVLTGGNGGRGGQAMNVNPAMNQQGQGANVQVMNALDGAQGGTGLAELANADGYLEGIPGGMFDWGE